MTSSALSALLVLPLAAACTHDGKSEGGGEKPSASVTRDDFGCLSGDQLDGSVEFEVGGFPVGGYLTGKGATGVVLSHMANSDVCSWVPQADELAGEGYRVLAVQSIGDEVAEITESARLLADKGATRVILMGASKGGTASVVAAPKIAEPPVAAVINLSGPSIYQGMDAEAAAAHLTVPVLYVAAKQDSGFAEDVTAQDKKSRKSPDARLDLADGNAHGTDLFGADPKVWEVVKAFMAKHR
ncbi:alpha/beta hydrolase family protein [Streptomyces sp. NPDC058755]|uniref:alpha/beta hydrolase family protein n=1 Tax=Streptomyces sp. NPDC058755 TaxID=3346624 RepID=UPI00369DCF8D